MKWTHKGIEIAVDGNGRFAATVGDLVVAADSIGECRFAIESELESKNKAKRLSLKVIGAISKDSYSSKSALLGGVATGINRTTQEVLVEGVPKGHDISHIMPDTQGNRKLLQDFLTAAALEKKLRDAVNKRTLKVAGWGRIELGCYPKKLSELETDYANKLRIKEKE